MASGRGTVIDFHSLQSQSKTQSPEVKGFSGESNKSSAINRLKKKYEPDLPSTSRQSRKGERYGKSTTSSLVTQDSPWTRYSEIYSLQFGDSDFFQVAEPRALIKSSDSDQNPMVIVSSFTCSINDDRMEYIQRIKNQHLVGVKKIFSMPEETFVAFEFMPLSLSEIAGHPLMDDIRLASILGQVVKGVIYLDSNCLEHTKLNCSNILIDASGNVKLWGYEHIQGRSTRGKHVQSLGKITMQLIQGYVNDQGRGGLDELHSCPVGAEFYSETKKALSVESLTKHPLLRLDWHKQRLAGLVSLALIWADRGYKFCI